MTTERRVDRSDEPREAARLYLQAVGRRGAHSAVALADADGLLIADSPGAVVDTEAVAAVAPLAGHSLSHEPNGLLKLVTRGEPMHVWDVEIDGDVYFLAAVGGEAEAPDGASAAFQRIFH